MNLLRLALDIQERLLFLKPVLRGPDPVFLKDLQPLRGSSAGRSSELWQTDASVYTLGRCDVDVTEAVCG